MTIKRIAIERKYGAYTSRYPQKIGLTAKKRIVSPVSKLPSRGPFKVFRNTFPSNQLKHFKRNQAIK